MEAVQTFKRLLELDLNTVGLCSDDKQSLESINHVSEKLNHLLESNILQDNIANLTDQQSTPFDENVSVTPGIDGEKVKTFEDLMNIKLQNDRVFMPTTNTSKPCFKRPFLKKGTGHAKFIKGDQNIQNQPIQNIRDVKDVLPKKNGENSNLINKPKVKFSTVIPISKKTVNQAPVILKIIKNSNSNQVSQDKSILNLNDGLPKLFVSSETDTKEKLDSHFKNKLFNNMVSQTIKKDLLGTSETFPLAPSTDFKEPRNSIYTVQIVKQIAKLENRLLELMALKSSLTTENSQSKEENSNMQLENILKEISKLNVKLSPILNNEFEEKEKNSPNNLLNIDSKSRDLCTQRHYSEPTISTLSNGDKIKLSEDHSITYEHLNGILQTVYQDGLRVVQFPNGQIERIHKNGTRQIIYTNGQQRIIKPDKSEEIIFNDGRVCTIFADGTEKIEYPNGDVEYKTHEYTKRHFKNGNIKTIFANGCQETIYCNGRIRYKDQFGNITFNQTPP